MIKEIFLLIIGGGITFIFTYLVNKIQNQAPRLLWRNLPVIRFPSLEKTAFNISLENKGGKVASDVKVLIRLPRDATVDSFDVNTSEKALKYEVEQLKKDEIKISIPVLHSKVECVFALLTNNLNDEDLQISVVSDQVVGTKKTEEDGGYTFWERLVVKRLPPVLAILVLLSMIFLVYSMVWGLARTNQYQEFDIAKFYLENGEYDLAIRKYQNLIHQWWFPGSHKGVYYDLAKAYAIKGEYDNASYYLEKVLENDKDMWLLLKADDSFQVFRSQDIYMKLIEKYEE